MFVFLNVRRFVCMIAGRVCIKVNQGLTYPKNSYLWFLYLQLFSEGPIYICMYVCIYG